jgi:large subunit ribosomal protein LP0
VQQVYESGNIYSPDVLDMTTEELRSRFQQGVRNIAAISLEIGYPTKASVPHSIVNAFKHLLAIAAETDITFKEAEKVGLFCPPSGLLLRGWVIIFERASI